MPIFFRTEGEPRSFWEVDREDCTVTTRWGELGGRGEEEVREPADENAVAYVEQLVAERRAQGFIPLDEAAPSKSRRASREKDDAYRDNGWQRLERPEAGGVRFWAVKIVDGELLRTRSGLSGTRGQQETLASGKRDSTARPWVHPSSRIRAGAYATFMPSASASVQARDVGSPGCDSISWSNRTSARASARRSTPGRSCTCCRRRRSPSDPWRSSRTWGRRRPA